MTVSRVLSERSHQVAEETRKRVLQVVRELEYVPVGQPVTQSRHVETRTLGLVFDGTPLKDFWGLPTFLGLHEAALAYDYDLLTLLRVRPDWMFDQEELQFLDRRNDGFIFVTPINRYQTMQALIRHQFPVVACYTGDVPPEVPIIMLDNFGAMQKSVQHLVENGHQRILYFTTMPHRADFQERTRGFEETMKAYGLQPCVLDIHNLPMSEVAPSLMTMIREQRITAIACVSDSLASIVWDITLAHGLKIPQDISFISMDDLDEMATRGLTSIHFSCEEVGRRAVETVADMLQGGENRASGGLVPVHLVERSSVASPT
jgi:LacI family transcriptional regulator